jgi:nucleoside-diphosphate-sugar epimerase
VWLQRGASVLATTRRRETAAELQTLGVEPIVCDVMRPETLTSLPAVDVAAYAVALDRASGQTMRDVYVQGLENVLRHLPQCGRFVYVGSSSVYGQTDGGWVDETSVTEPQEESGRIVLEAEQVLRAARPDAIVLRFAGIYGPGRLLRKQTILAGEPIVGDADKWLNLIHVDDGVSAVIAACERGEPGSVYNVCDDRPVRRRDFYRELARRLQANEPRFELPPAGAPTPPHERANRRIRNARLKELDVVLRFPDYVAGLEHATAT